MSCLVKICGLKYAATVDAAVEAGADAVGFVFAKSVRQVTARHAAFIATKVPEHVMRVAVMMHPSADEWAEVNTIFCPDVLQTDAEDFDYLDVPEEVTRWPVIREGKVPAMGDLPDTFVYEGMKSGQGETVDWRVAGKLARRARLILAGGLSRENVSEAIRQVGPFGIDVSSAVESSPGEKDPEMISAFIEAVRATPNPGSKSAGAGQ
ncbi:MAG: N-(5'-phosphoribosyl)anthranilate isomerase [Woeseiaceae bacterium]